MKKFGVLALIVVLAASVFALYRFRETGRIVVKLVPGPPTPRIPAAEAGIDPAAIQLAVDYAAKRKTSALVIGRNGHIVFEKYWGDTTADTPVSTDRFAAVLGPLLVGSVMNDGLIRDLDAPVTSYHPDLARAPSGPGGAYSLREHLGSRASHGEMPAEIVALVLERVAKQPFETLVTERLWKPLGGGDLSFRRVAARMRSDVAAAGCCVIARISDWMRIGELLANDGVFEGNQFTPPRFVKLMLTPVSKESPWGFGVNVDGRFAAADVAWLEGGQNQRLWVVPSLQLVILRVGDEPDASDGWDEAMIPDSIIRGTSGWKPKSVGEGIDPNKFAPH